MGHIAKSFGLRDAPTVSGISKNSLVSKSITDRQEKRRSKAGFRGGASGDLMNEKGKWELKQASGNNLKRQATRISSISEFGDGGLGLSGGLRKKQKRILI